MQGLLGKPRVPPSPLFVFDTQPLTKPPAGVLLHRSVGLTDRPQTEVVSPTINLPVERFYQRCRILRPCKAAEIEQFDIDLQNQSGLVRVSCFNASARDRSPMAPASLPT